MKVVFFFLFSVIYSTADVGLNRPKTLRFDRILGKCKAYPKPSIYIENARVGQANEFDMRLVVVKEIGNKAKISITKDRCQNRESLDTCESMGGVNGKQFCELIKMENQMWTSVVNAFQPTLECPIKPGTYTVQNAAINSTFMETFTVDGHYWRIEVQITDPDKDDKVIGCFQADGKVTHEQVAKPKPKPTTTTTTTTTTQKPSSRLISFREKVRQKADSMMKAQKVSVTTTDVPEMFDGDKIDGGDSIIRKKG